VFQDAGDIRDEEIPRLPKQPGVPDTKPTKEYGPDILAPTKSISARRLTHMEKQTLTFTLERETKNTIRYQEDANGKPPAIGTLYVQKWLLGKEPPRRLAVTVGEVEEEP
jgi:hypothetical protein